MLISLVEAINIPAGVEGLMRWHPPLFTPRRAQAMRNLELLIILGLRMPLNGVMLAMTRRRAPETDGRVGSGRQNETEQQKQKGLEVKRLAVRAFSLVWLLLDVDLLQRLWRSRRSVR